MLNEERILSELRAIRKEQNKIMKLLTQKQEEDRWMTQGAFIEKTKLTNSQCAHLRHNYPQLIRWEKSGKIDKVGREIRRNPLYDYIGWLEIFKATARWHK